MEGVIVKLKWGVFDQINARRRPSDTAWEERREIDRAMYEIARPIKDQLEEDATWKE